MSAEGKPTAAQDRRDSIDRAQADVWICRAHQRWVRISKPEGDTLRPCPECPRGHPAPVYKSRRPLTGLTA